MRKRHYEVKVLNIGWGKQDVMRDKSKLCKLILQVFLNFLLMLVYGVSSVSKCIIYSPRVDFMATNNIYFIDVHDGLWSHMVVYNVIW